MSRKIIFEIMFPVRTDYHYFVTVPQKGFGTTSGASLYFELNFIIKTNSSNWRVHHIFLCVEI
jgi:hypothetical protein